MSEVLVVGVAGGVGKEVARLLIKQGYKVLGTTHSKDQIAATLAGLPGIKDVFPLDLANADHTRDTLRCKLQNISLKGAIVCAAVSGYGPMETASLSKFREFLEINTVSNLAIYQACIPALRETSGRLVFISSHSGVVAFPFHGLYQASKFALEGMADTLRQEAADFNVKIVLVQPGGIDTPMSRTMGKNLVDDIATLTTRENEQYGYLYQQLKGRIESATNMSTAQEVAKTVFHAFTDTDPEPRYRIGEDTEFLLSKRQALSDRELDTFIKQL